ncbi:MAG: tetratricopeptide repeat protein [Paludibacteraceae bacterium]|nr:tetratricopeptide repeat protein [Paludibacteraceae bacterium]
MKIKIYGILVALLVCFNIQANENFELIKAEEAYAASDYDKALEIYKSVLDKGYESADLYYNVANCFYRKGELAPSILNYERALRIDPSHEDAKHNLSLAESKTVDNIDTLGRVFLLDWWNSFSNLTSADSWAFISIVLFIITLVSLSVYIFVRKIWVRKLGFSVAVIALFFTIISFCSAYTRYNVETSKNQAIVFSQTVTIKSSPDNSGNNLFILHEGTKVNIKSRLGEWVEIITSDGNSGWLPANAIEVI